MKKDKDVSSFEEQGARLRMLTPPRDHNWTSVGSFGNFSRAVVKAVEKLAKK